MNNYLFFLVGLLSVLSYLFITTSIRFKFLYFILLVISYSILGFLFNLDGMMLVLMVAEFTIILLFFMTYMQLYTNFSFLSKNFNGKFLFILLFFFAFSDDVYLTYIYISFYKSVNHVVSSDFFILFYILFLNSKFLVIFITVILTFFSFFFILLYFYLKEVKTTFKSCANNLYFLRKQVLLKQTGYFNNITSFQL